MLGCKLALLVALMMALGPEAIAAGPWRRFVKAEDGFAVDFSGRIKETATKLGAKIQPLVARAITYTQDGGDFVYAVGVQHNRRSTDFSEAVTMSFGGLDCASVDEPVPLRVQGAYGAELRGSGCLHGDFRAILRYFTRDLTLFQVLAIYRRDEDEDNAMRFLESFKLLSPARS